MIEIPNGIRCFDTVPSEYVPFALLTVRERQVLQQRADGFSHAEIAKNLGISAKTVQIYIHSTSNIALGSRMRRSLRNHEYPHQTRITFIGLIQDGIARGYLNHDFLDSQVKPLSSRQNELIELLLNTGRSSQEIADGYEISVKTIETHINRIHKKLKTRSVYHLAARVTYLKMNNLWPEPMENRGRANHLG